MNFPEELVECLKRASAAGAMTGAGVSAESGIPTFRGKDGWWRNHNPMELATPEAFENDPRLVWEWYDYRRELISKCSPNPAHITLAEMERKLQFCVITQNVDGLHQKAGSRNVVELHGNIWRTRSTGSGETVYNYDVPIIKDRHLPKDDEGCLMRPDIVWFGENLPLDQVMKADEWISRSSPDVFFVIGTTAVFYYIQRWTQQVAEKDTLLVEINLNRSEISSMADYFLEGKAGEILPELWAAANT